MSSRPHQRRSARPLIIGFAVLAVLIAAAGYWAWRLQAQSIRTQAERSLVAVGKLKADQISGWLDERRGDAQIIRADPLISAATADLLAGRDAATAGADLRAVLEAFRRTYGYAAVVMTSPEGAVLLHSPRAASGPLGAQTKALVTKAAATGRVQTSDLYLDAAGRPRIDFVAPVPSTKRGSPAVAAVTLSADPSTTLYPLIRTWPVPSRSGETLLVERHGKQVLFLNDLRFRKHTALKLTSSAGAPSLPAAMAVRGRRGVVQGLDYRSVPVLAALQPVPGSPWFIVAKENTNDVLGPTRLRGWLTAVIALVLVALAGIGTLLLWRLRETQVSADISESEARYRTLVENIPQRIFLKDTQYRWVSVNENLADALGLRPEDVIGKTDYDLFPKELADKYREDDRRVMATGQTEETEELTVLDDRESWVNTTKTPVTDESGAVVGVLGVFWDITERKRSDEALRNSEATLRAILDSTPFPVALVDAQDDAIDYWSRSAIALFGHTAPTAAEWYELAYPDPAYRQEVIERWKPCLEEARRSGQAVNTGEYRVACADGSMRICELYATFLADRLVVTFHDVTERKRSEEALRESEDKFKYVFDHSVTAMSFTLPTGEINVNDAFCQMLGYSREEFEKRTWQEVSHPDDIASTQEQIDTLLSGAADSCRFVKRYLHKDGSVVWADVATSLRRDVTGEPLYLMTVIVDITERKRAEETLRESEERLRFLVDQTPTVNWMLDRDLRFTQSRGAGLKTLGLEPDQVLGMDVGDYLGGAGPQADLGVAMHERALAGESFVYEQPAGDLTFDTVLGPLRDADDAIVGVIGVAYDTTARKQADEARREAERSLAALNVELEQRVLDRTAQLDAVNQELEAFTYSVSHDLRAPLRHISGFSALLAERAGDSLDEKSHHYVDTISRSVREMGVLIDDLLEFSRAGRAEIHIEDVDMDATLAEALEPLQRETEDRDIEWSIAPLPHVVGDHALLRQVWANLLGNAVKYTRGRTPARVEVGARGGEAIDEDVFWVRDNGAGFDMQYAHKLYGVFQRLHTSAEFEGTGIGLANVQRIVNRLGGRVWAEGKTDEGATFSFSLPRRKETPS